MTTITVTRYPDPTWQTRKAIDTLELYLKGYQAPEPLRELAQQLTDAILKHYARDEYRDDRASYAISLLGSAMNYASLGGEPTKGIRAYFQMQPERLRNQLLEICREARKETPEWNL